MITQRIVLVLGAGASMPFGFPSGRALKNEIVKTLVPRNQKLLQLEEAGFGTGLIRDFREALRKSGKQSVDAFLEHRTEFLEVGKAATASALLPLEIEDSLFQESWYEYFFRKLNARFEEFSQNAVSVLTFNYDRSLEHYLFTALRNAYGKTDKECADALGTIRILHLYGQLGALPYMAANNGGIPYGTPLDAAVITGAARGIRIIHEAANEEVFKQAQAALGDARMVCFLGFGYDETNMQRLLGYSPGPHPPKVFGSALNLTARECELISRQISHTRISRGCVGEGLW